MPAAPLAPPSLRPLAALHRRHAQRLRTGARWLGVGDAVRDRVLARCFAEQAAHVPEDSTSGWVCLMRRLVAAAAGGDAPEPQTAEEVALFGFLWRISAGERAVFVLAELGGFDADALARAIGAPPESGRAQIVGLRRALAEDPAAAACGGPAGVLRACVEADLPPPGWQGSHWRVLEDMLSGAPRTSPWIAAATLAALAFAAWEFVRPDAVAVAVAGPEALAPAAGAEQAPEVVPQLAPPAAPALPLPAPKDMSTPTPQKVSAVVKARPRRPAAARRDEALAARAEKAAARDPGVVIVELEMLSAARKALAGRPGQALAYVEQHAREFPGTQLAEQQAELRVRALCGLGRAGEARAEAQRRAWPKVQAALQEACR